MMRRPTIARTATRVFLAVGVAAGALTAVPAPAAQGASAVPGQLSVPPIAYKTRKLKNGLAVYTLRDTTTPNVVVSIWYDVGSKHDPEGRSGFAHLFEHILSRKTVNMPYNMVSQMTEDVGGIRNASTWYDRTNYFEIVPARYLETMLWTHAERMARPVVDEQVFESERNIVKEELRQNVLAPPYGRLFRFVLAENSYDTLPNRRPTIGSLDQLDAATLEDARAFHEAYYGPDTAALIISGNFDEAQLQAWVDKYFADIPPRAKKIPLKIEGAEKPRTSPRLVNAYAPNVPLPAIATSWKLPPFSHPDLPALEVLNAILTAGDSSRLHKALVEGEQLATEVSGNWFVNVEDGGYYAPFAILAGGKTIEDAERAFAAEFERVRSQPVSAAELAEAKNELLASALRARESADERAFELGEALVRTGDPRAADRRLAGIQKVTIADVQRVARKYLAANARVDVRYRNESEAPKGQANSWANPVPMPKFKDVPPPTRAPNALAEDGKRQAPPAPTAAVPVTLPTISESRLPTGLRIVTARTGPVPIATMTLVLRGGGATDPAGKAGLSNLAADLATKGTKTRTARQIAAEMESLGATLNSGAGVDGITLSVSAPTANLEAAGRILADIAQNATFPEAELERERKRAIDSLAIAIKSPGALAGMVAQPILYGSAPYGSLLGGTPASLRSLTVADLKQHHRSWWHPANAALIISGGIEGAAASQLAGRLFGDWRGEGTPPQAPASRAGQPGSPRVVVIDNPAASQAAVLAAVPAVDRADPDYYNLLAANAVLGAGSTGRLFQEVRSKRGLSYGAGSSIPPRLDDAWLTASAQTKNETAAEVAQIFLTEFDRLGKDRFQADALDKRKAFLAGNFTRQAGTSSGFGATLANLIIQGMPLAEATRYIQQLESVSPEAASKVAGRLVSSDKATLVIVGDASKFADKLRAIRPNVEVIPIDQLDLDSPTLKKGG